MVLDLTVGVGEVLEGAVSDRDAMFESVFDLTLEEERRDFVLVIVLVLLLRNEDDAGKVIHQVLVLAGAVTRLLLPKR